MQHPLSHLKFSVTTLLLAAGLSGAIAQSNTVTVQVNLPGAVISSNLFGIFFEEINMAGDGGIYYEQIRNRSFEDTASINSGSSFWTLITNGTATGAWTIDTSQPLSTNNNQCLRLSLLSGPGSVDAVNRGYYGIKLTNGGTYNLSLYARGSNTFTGPITALLESSNGAVVYAQTNFTGLTTNWQQFTTSLTVATNDPAARLDLSLGQVGTVYIDFVSLFPSQTYNNRTNGLRPDLFNSLAAIKPSFMRFPGGSWVDGTSLATAYHWELTVSNLTTRVPRTNVWGYMVDNGLGFHEYLQMCEDLGVQPLFCINCGMTGSTGVATNQLGPWIQEALNAIQYANGATNTPWGAQRAANGHPAPFNLQYMEIGNENSGTSYNVNYGLFYNAIKSNYPTINLIGDSFGTIPTSAEVDTLDEHYYESTTWFAQNSTKYDSYPRPGPKIFVGEYATGYGINFQPQLQNAVAEAAWMTGLERNSDLVTMACYAPLFCNRSNTGWNPNLIYFNGTQVYGSPSYYVQQMFSVNRGKLVLPTTVNAATSDTIFVSSSYVPSSNLVILKAVNVSTSNQATTFTLNGVGGIATNATLVQLAGALTASNSLANPTNVYPVTTTINNAGTNFTVTLPSNSVSIYILQASSVNGPTNLLFTVASPLSIGQESQSSLSAQLPGNNTVSLAGNYAVSYSSSNTNIAVVNSSGVVIGAGLGNTTIIATYDNLTATQTVQVVSAPATTLIHRYSFNDGTANDSIGNINGTFYNTSGNSSISGGQLNLVGSTGDYVDFGPGVINTTNITTGAITLEAWATFNSVNGAWARLFDFGNIDGADGGNYIFLTCNNTANGGDARVAVSATETGGNETGITLGNNFLGATNMHVVVVFNPAPNRQFLGIYTNGVLASSTPTADKTIASLNDQFSFLGRSLWSSDAWLSGSINEFRIYNGELNRFQIAASYAAGPDQTNYNVGTVTSFTLNPGPMPVAIYGSQTVAAYMNFTMATNVNVTGDPNLTLTSGNTNIFTVSSPSGVITALGVGTATLTGVYNYVNGNSSTLYTNTATVTVYRDQPATLVHRYSFSESGGTNTADSVGGPAWNGVLTNGGTLTNGQVYLNGSSQFVLLPGGIISNQTAVTIEAWASFGTLPANCFLFGFGNSIGANGVDYIFCQPQNGRIAITATNYPGEQSTGNAGSWSGLTNLHITAVFDCPAGYIALYTNGGLAIEDNAVTLPLSVVNNVLSYLGRSLYSGDSYINGSIDEFRVYNGVLHADEIAATQALGPNSVLTVSSPTITCSNSGGNIVLSWPVAAAGFTLMSESNTGSGNWSAVFPSPQIVGSQWQVSVPPSGTAQYFRLQR